MKLYKKLLILSAALCTVAVSSATAFAEPVDSEPAPDIPSAVEPAPELPDSSADVPGSSVEPVQPNYSSTPSQNYQTPPAADNSSSVNNGGNSGAASNGTPSYGQDYNQNGNQSAGQVSPENSASFSENTVSGSTGEGDIYYSGETDPSLDNKLFNTGETPNENNMNENDWKSILDFNSSGGGDDFGFIKNNNSKDDSVLYQLMLYGGVLLIAVALAGIVLIIVMTVKAHKANKLKRSRAGAYDEQPDGNDAVDISKYDTGDIDIDLSKYDKYL